MEWRVAQSLLTLRDEINAKWPSRSKDSDGTIGDANHASRSSDHNPWIADPPGPHVVSAMDITHDPSGGCDSYALAQWLLDHRDPRIKYVISYRRIASGAGGSSPWIWRKYTGINPHDHHVHISVKDSKPLFDSTKPWGIAEGSMPVHNLPHPPIPPLPTQRRGANNPYVGTIQKRLGIFVDNQFGLHTEKAVTDFQKAHGLHADGIVGPQTWIALG